MVLLVVDAQKLITNARLYNFDGFAANVRRLIATARENGVEVVYVRHDDGADKPLTRGTAGFEIYEAFTPMAGERIFDKRVNSPFRDSGLLEYLWERQIKQIAVVGLQTEYCIDATVKCGFEHGFEMIVPDGANSTFDNEYMTAKETYEYYNRSIWNGRYAQCVSMEEAIEKMKDRISAEHIRRE